MKEIMLYKQNPDTKDWLCWIPNSSQAYYYRFKKDAKKFCEKINKLFADGTLCFDENGNVIVKK